MQYLINLESRLDRLIFSKGWIKGEIKVLKAIDGSRVEIKGLIFDNKFDRPSFDLIFNTLTNTEKACFASHLMCIKLFNESKEEFCTIFEDDIRINCNLESDKIIDLVKEKLPQDFDICFLNNDLNENQFVNSSKLEIEKMNKKVDFSKGNTGSASYIISKQGSEKFLNIVRKYGVKEPIDWYIKFCSDEINVYKCNMNLFVQKNLKDTNIKHSLGKII